MAAPCRAHDKKHFPGADVVRVGSQRWLTQHEETLCELVAEAAGFVEARRGVAFDERVCSRRSGGGAMKQGLQSAEDGPQLAAT